MEKRQLDLCRCRLEKAKDDCRVSKSNLDTHLTQLTLPLNLLSQRFKNRTVHNPDKPEPKRAVLSGKLQITNHKLQTNHNPKITNHKKNCVLRTDF